MYYVCFPSSSRQVEDILHESGIDICHETIRFWWNRFGPILAKDAKQKASRAPLELAIFECINGFTIQGSDIQFQFGKAHWLLNR